MSTKTESIPEYGSNLVRLEMEKALMRLITGSVCLLASLMDQVPWATWTPTLVHDPEDGWFSEDPVESVTRRAMAIARRSKSLCW